MSITNTEVMGAVVWPYSGVMDLINLPTVLSLKGDGELGMVAYTTLPALGAGYAFYRYCDPVMSQSWTTLAIGYGIGAGVYLGGKVLISKFASGSGKSTNNVHN